MKKVTSKKIAIMVIMAMVLLLLPVASAFAAVPALGAATVNANGNQIDVATTGSPYDLQQIVNKPGWKVTVVDAAYKKTNMNVSYVECTNGTVKIYLDGARGNVITDTDTVYVYYTKPGDADKAIRNAEGFAANTAKDGIKATNSSTVKKPTVDWNTSTVNANGISVTVKMTGDTLFTSGLKGVNLTSKHGWTLKKAAVGTTAYAPLQITKVDINNDNVVLHVYDSAKNKMLPTDTVKVAYKAPTDIDKKILGSKKQVVGDIAETVIADNDSAIKVASVDYTTTATYVYSAGTQVKVKITNNDTAQSYTDITTGHGWTVAAAAYGKTTYSPVTVTKASLSTGGVVTLDLKTIIQQGDKVQIKYIKPSNTTCVIKSSDGIEMSAMTKNSADIQNDSDAVPPKLLDVASTTNAYVYGTTLKIKVSNLDAATATSKTGWVIKQVSPAKTMIINSVSATGNIITFTLSADIVGNATIAYTKPSTGYVKSTYNLPLETFTAQTITNSNQNW